MQTDHNDKNDGGRHRLRSGSVGLPSPIPMLFAKHGGAGGREPEAGSWPTVAGLTYPAESSGCPRCPAAPLTVGESPAGAIASAKG